LRVLMKHTNKASFPVTLFITVLSLGSIAIAHSAKASSNLSSYPVSQTPSSPAPANKPKIVLTETQIMQIREINKKSSEQIVALLTPEQQAVIQNEAQTKPASGAIEAKLKLTQEQKAKIQEIQEQNQKQIQSILTPEQLQMLKSNSTP
jgi:Spy/CpxP family protein refolding chaperone